MKKITRNDKYRGDSLHKCMCGSTPSYAFHPDGGISVECKNCGAEIGKTKSIHNAATLWNYCNS